MPTRPTADLIPPGTLAAEEVRRHLDAARDRLRALTGDLDGERLLGPKLAIVNPVLWEIGHVAWFQEHWCLRMRPDGTLAPSRLDGADRLYDSSAIPHAVRWDLPLPSHAVTRAYLEAVLDDVQAAIARRPEDERLLYFAELAACHEDMHGEAFHYTRQTLGYPAPSLPLTPPAPTAAGADGDAAFEGGVFSLGATPGAGFVHDNEKWAHPVKVAPFRIARAAVTQPRVRGVRRRRRLFAPRMVDGRGLDVAYRTHGRGTAVLAPAGRRVERAPVRPLAAARAGRAGRARGLVRGAGVLPLRAPAAADRGGMGVRRLRRRDEPKPATPWHSTRASTAHANLEGSVRSPVAAYPGGDTLRGCRQLFGNVWEWTASTFGPYPGFVADPYKEYSAPWFGTHKVLRGGSFATPVRLLRTTWRNFYTPDRYDVFAGFRTCAV